MEIFSEIIAASSFDNILLPAGLPRSGKLPVLFLLTGQKSGFSPRRGDSLHRFRSNFAGVLEDQMCLTTRTLNDS